MIHPNTELRTVSPEVGVGVFAKGFIPKGTITYVQDLLEIVVPQDSPILKNPMLKQVIDTYAIITADGKYELSWDYAKHMNHCCHYNTLTTGFGFDVAIRDIQPGEQLLCDYGMFNVDYSMDLICHFEDCRKKVRTSDFDACLDRWEADVQATLPLVRTVPQPLWGVLDEESRKQFEHYLDTGEGYIPIATHKLGAVKSG